MSPLKFNTALEDALKKARLTNMGIKVDSNIDILAFADDVTILTENKENLEKLSNMCIKETELMGFKDNDGKRKYIYFSLEESSHEMTHCK